MVVACGCEALFGPTLAAAATELVVAAGVALAIEGLCLVLCDPARATIMRIMADKLIIVSEMPFKVRRLLRLLRRRRAVM